MQKKLLPWIKGLLTSYGLASFSEVLGNPSVTILIIWVICSFFYIYMDEKEKKEDISYKVLALIWALLIPLGQVLGEYSDLSPVFSSPLNIIKVLITIAGFYFVFSTITAYLPMLLSNLKPLSEEEHFFSRKAFLKSFLILEGVYLLAVLMNFPGNLCYDTEGQMEQVLGLVPYSAHHPLLSTLILGLPVKLGLMLTGSRAIGIFFCMLVQISMLAAGLSYSIYKLGSKKVGKAYLLGLLTIYIAAPIYTNLVSTAIKDVSFISAFIVYFVCLVNVAGDRTLLKNKSFMAFFILFQILTCLLRKNGLYVVVLTGIIWSLINIRKGFKELLVNALGLFLVAAIGATLLNNLMIAGFKAEKPSAGEALSLPFQITARYVADYKDELTDREKEAISAVLGDDMERIAGRYNPLLSDAVKSLYNKDAETKDLVNYIGSLTGMFFKHPGVFVEGFLVHTYGWYCPTVSTATRYETNDDEFFVPGGILAVMDKVMIFIYRYADGISLLGLLQNAAFYVWSFWFLTIYQKKNKLRPAGIALWISLLVCFIAPAFMEHTRYAFPIIISMPFFFISTLVACEQETVNEINEEA